LIIIGKRYARGDGGGGGILGGDQGITLINYHRNYPRVSGAWVAAANFDVLIYARTRSVMKTKKKVDEQRGGKYRRIRLVRRGIKYAKCVRPDLAAEWGPMPPWYLDQVFAYAPGEEIREFCRLTKEWLKNRGASPHAQRLLGNTPETVGLLQKWYLSNNGKVTCRRPSRDAGCRENGPFPRTWIIMR
jgi:hypothetical protein